MYAFIFWETLQNSPSRPAPCPGMGSQRNQAPHHLYRVLCYQLRRKRDEILRAVKKIVGAHIPEKDITEETIKA